jgi:hypothetical protein
MRSAAPVDVVAAENAKRRMLQKMTDMQMNRVTEQSIVQ